MNKRFFTIKESLQLDFSLNPSVCSSTIVFGIVGGIGSGKSFTTAEFVAQGAVWFDADQEAKSLYDKPEIIAEMKKYWDNVVDAHRQVDRQTLAQIIFAPTLEGAQARERLSEIIRPHLLKTFISWLNQRKEEGCEFVVLDAPLLFEARWDSFVNYVVFVDASEETRLRRIAARGWTADELKKREACQLALSIKKERSDFIVTADQDNSQMEIQVAKILDEVRRIRSAPDPKSSANKRDL